MSRDIVWTTKFKKDYKLAMKLSRTGTHSDLFGK
jgi:mRNA-degrading endonuclease YafQ of YafQ-DinJ toxin-antitoxin module